MMYAVCLNVIIIITNSVPIDVFALHCPGSNSLWNSDENIFNGYLVLILLQSTEFKWLMPLDGNKLTHLSTAAPARSNQNAN